MGCYRFTSHREVFSPSSGHAVPNLRGEYSYLIADAVAEPAVDFVDLNSSVAADGLRMPDDARPGRAYPMSFDPGGLLDAEVIQHPDGTLGYRLDLETVRFSAPAEIDWAVGILWQDRVVLLPGEQAGTAGDPLAKAIGNDLAETVDILRARARDHGVGEGTRERWSTLRDLDNARGLISRAAGGNDWLWSCAAAAILDGEAEEAKRFASRLRG